MKLGSLYQRAFKRLEPDDGKLSCPVLRGRRRWKLLLCYPTLIFLLLSPLGAKGPNHCWPKDSVEERRRQLLNTAARKQETDLFIFVSMSLHKDHLLELGREAKTHGGVLVLKGLVNDSFRETVRSCRFLFEEDIGLLIDPQLFGDHNIQHVPAFVLTDGKNVDSLSGAVSISYVLRTFSNEGDLRQDAQRRLK